MRIGSAEVVAIMAIGIAATLLMDIWNFFLRRAFKIPSLDYCSLGRWISHMPSGRFRHANIATVSPKPYECPVGWIAHYTIGVVFAAAFVAAASTEWLAAPTLLPALLFGIATVVFPLFIMQPALGLGIASSKTPRPARARLKSLSTHVIFGLGLYLAALSVNYALP